MLKIPTNPRFNCLFGCKEGGPLHHFPKPESDKKRFDVWKSVLSSYIKESRDKYIYNQYRLCNKHFENYYISPSNRLTRNAFPTLYIGDGKLHGFPKPNNGKRRFNTKKSVLNNHIKKNETFIHFRHLYKLKIITNHEVTC